MELICASLNLFSVAVIGVLLIGVCLKKEHPKPFGKKIILLLVGHMIGLLCDSVLWLWNPELFPNIDISVAVVVQKIASLIAYSMLTGMTIVYTDCLIKYISEKTHVSKRIFPYITAVCIMAVALWTISIFNGMFFTFDEKGMFVTTQLYCVSQSIIGLLLCVDVLLILKHRKVIEWRNAIPLLLYVLFPIIGFSLFFWLDVTPVYMAATLSMLLMFIVFHLEQDKQLREQERQLTQSRISIMLTQIQPHFLYNTLTAICGLCDSDPKEAKKVTAKFSDYLRHNLETLNNSEPISFDRELRHTQAYLEIEQKRFGEKLNIVYDIETDNFFLPALTLQPIAENAVKHGVTKRMAGGTITISTREQESYHEIIVADNGVGFDHTKPRVEPNTHIGIENVQSRLWSICNGTLNITSEVNVGTIATIKIPKCRILPRHL